MPNSRHNLAQFLLDAKNLIAGASESPELATVLSAYGYDAERLSQGKKLLSEADALSAKKADELGGRLEATQDFGKTWDGANSSYMKTLKVARLAFGDDAKAVAALKLYGARKETVAGWLEQAGIFYANLEAEPRLAAALSRFGYCAEKLKAEASLVEAVAKSTQVKVKENGAAQAATVARDKKVRELDTWVGELRAIARIAFYEQPQELEKLGIMVRNSPGRPKKAAAAKGDAAAKA